MATWFSDSYDGRYMQLTITEVVNVSSNSSTLDWTLTSAGGVSSYYTIDETIVTINGVEVYYKERTAWDSRVFPAAKGSVSGTIVVNHDYDGTKTIDVGFSTRVYVYGPLEYGGTMTLANIDRTAPTVSVGVSGISANGFTITGYSSATANSWFYSLDSGDTWTQFSTTSSTSASTTLVGLSPNTGYYVRVAALKKTNRVFGYSSSVYVKTLGGATINSVNDVTADDATVSIKLNATVQEASYNNTVVLKNGNTTYLTISGLSWSKGTADRTITLTAAQRTTLLTAMASIKSFTGTFELSTYSGSTQIGSTSSKTATVQTTAANSAPTVSSFTFADSNSTTTAITGNNQLFIQGYSTLKVTPGSATAKNGASIASYTASCSGASASNTSGAAITVGSIRSSGTVDVVLTITDSRGYTASVTQSVTVIAYAKPKLQDLSLRRTNDIEAEMRLELNGSISAITVGGVQKNSLLYVRYRYKLTSAANYGSYTDILPSVTRSGTSFSYSNPELCNLDSNSSYNFHLQIRDVLDSQSSLDLYYVIPQGTPLVALRKGMVGINTPTPAAALHVVGDSLVQGNFDVQGDCVIHGTLIPDNLQYDFDFDFEKPYFGTCATAADVADKVVTCADYTELKTGTMIAVQFTNVNTNSNPTMNVNGTGARAICGNSGYYIGTNMWTANEIMIFVFNGTWWVSVGGVNATTARYGKTMLTNSVASTSSGLAATAYAVKLAYDRNSWNSIALDNPLDIAYGGTGSTYAAGARSNLGIYCTLLYTGTLTTGSTTFNYGSYKAYIIIGQPSSAGARCAVVIPASQLTTTATAYQFADESYYYSFNLSYSGTTVTLAYKGRSSSGQIIRIYGVN